MEERAHTKEKGRKEGNWTLLCTCSSAIERRTSSKSMGLTKNQNVLKSPSRSTQGSSCNSRHRLLLTEVNPVMSSSRKLALHNSIAFP
eukprot:5885751-Amphidinium_carterae.2